MLGGSGVAVGSGAGVGEGVGDAVERRATACGVVPATAMTIAATSKAGKRKRFTISGCPLVG